MLAVSTTCGASREAWHFWECSCLLRFSKVVFRHPTFSLLLWKMVPIRAVFSPEGHLHMSYLNVTFSYLAVHCGKLLALYCWAKCRPICIFTRIGVLFSVYNISVTHSESNPGPTRRVAREWAVCREELLREHFPKPCVPAPSRGNPQSLPTPTPPLWLLRVLSPPDSPYGSRSSVFTPLRPSPPVS